MTELILDLHAPGMTALHTAGLGALAATLLAWDEAVEDGQIQPSQLAAELGSLSWVVERERVTLRFDEQDAVSLVKMIRKAMWCDERGVLRFWLLERGGSPPSELLRYQLQEGLLGTLLQHNQFRVTLEPARAEQVVTIDEREFVFNLLRLQDIAHLKDAKKLVDKNGRLVKESLEIKGWAIPGAAKRHEAVDGSVLSEPPERFICLIFGVLGALPFRISSRMGGKRYSWALVAPQVVDLEQFGAARRQLMGSASFLIAAGAGDAALKMWAQLRASKALASQREAIAGCVAVALGSVPWASQQQTRTDLLTMEQPTERVLRSLALLDVHLGPTLRAGKNGAFWSVPVWRTLISDNLARDRPIWRGLHRAASEEPEIADALFRHERVELARFVHALMEEHMLGSEQQELFVKVWHAALARRYAKLYERAQDEKLDGNALVSNEYDRIRAELGRCKNAATLRAACVDFWARGGQNRAAQEHWRELLRFFEAEHWELARDLSLLSLASYQSTSKQEQHGDDEQAEGA
jgi:CRISPR-associated protein Cas8a1/Csx13